MVTQPESQSRAVAGKLCSRIAILMFGIVGGTCLMLDGMANAQPVQDWMRRLAWQESKWKKQLPIFCWHSHLVDYEDRLFHEEIPSADFSRGGAFFMGASNMKWALKLWELPAETRPLIRNFAFGGSKHSSQFDLIRYLVEQRGFLSAGGEKTLIVIGLNYRNAHHGRLTADGRDEYYERLWTRHGIYRVDPDGSIHPSRLSALAKAIILERTKITGILKELVNLAYAPLKPTRVVDPDAYNRSWVESMGPDWKELILAQAGEFARMVDYLQQRNVKVVGVRMPVGSWDDDLPFEQVYIRQIREICAAKGVRIYDFTRMLDDEEFVDSVHLTPVGIEKFQPAVMEIALDHLRSTGALPADYAQPKPGARGSD